MNLFNKIKHLQVNNDHNVECQKRSETTEVRKTLLLIVNNSFFMFIDIHEYF